MRGGSTRDVCRRSGAPRSTRRPGTTSVSGAGRAAPRAMTLVTADALTAEGNQLFQAQDFGAAAARFERATSVFPTHHLAWKGLGHAQLCLGRPADAARAFDRAIGLRPESATALWGGALAHADLGHALVAQNYLR